MSKFIVVSRVTFGTNELVSMGSTLCFSEFDNAKAEAQKQANTFSIGQWEVYQLTEPLFVVTAQPIEAASLEA